MDSAGPVASRIAGQPTVSTGTNTFFATGTNKAEFALAFAFDWLDNPRGRARHRDACHPSATGEGQPA